MLADVTGRVGLMERDLAELMLSIRIQRACSPWLKPVRILEGA